MGPIGFNELIILALILVLLIVPVVVAYRMGKQKGRLLEMERQRQDKI